MLPRPNAPPSPRDPHSRGGISSDPHNSDPATAETPSSAEDRGDRGEAKGDRGDRGEAKGDRGEAKGDRGEIKGDRVAKGASTTTASCTTSCFHVGGERVSGTLWLGGLGLGLRLGLTLTLTLTSNTKWFFRHLVHEPAWKHHRPVSVHTNKA